MDLSQKVLYLIVIANLLASLGICRIQPSDNVVLNVGLIIILQLTLLYSSIKIFRRANGQVKNDDINVKKVNSNCPTFFMTTQVFGAIVYISLYILYNSTDGRLHNLAIFLLNNVVYHMGEFMLVCLYHYETLCWRSFMLNHSAAYNLAFGLAITEFFSEYFLLDLSYKYNQWATILGSIFCFVGHFFRIGAFVNAKSNFNHLVQQNRANEHILVKTGLYAFSRHPSYFGFFLYSIGGQIILLNWICLIGYSYTLWQFFYERILQLTILNVFSNEEFYLVKFFGDEYIQYRQQTGSLLFGMDYFLKRKRMMYNIMYNKQF